MMCSGCIEKPIVRPSVPSSVVETAVVTSDVDCVSYAAILSGIEPPSDEQMLSSTCCDDEPSCQLPQSSDEPVMYEMCASPQPTDCLNDIWLSSAAVNLQSPLTPRNSESFILRHSAT